MTTTDTKRLTAVAVEIYLEWDPSDPEGADASALLEEIGVDSVRAEVLELLDEYVTATTHAIGLPVYMHVMEGGPS